MSAVASTPSDAAVVRELEAQRKATNYRDADTHLTKAIQLLGSGTSDSVRLRVESIECQEDSFENDDPDGRLSRVALAGQARAKRSNEAEAAARFALCAGNVFTAQGQFARAEKAYGQALDYARRLRSPGLEAATLSLRGALASSRGSFRDALLDQLRARDLFEVAGELKNLLSVTNELANLYQRLGDYATALAYYESVYKSFAASAEDDDLSAIQGNLAVANDALGRQAQALDLVKQALASAQRAKDPLQTAIIGIKQGGILVHAGQPALALRALAPAHRYFESQGNRERLAQVDLSAAQALEMLHRPAEALLRVQAARGPLASNKSLINLSRAQALEGRLLSALGRYREAYEISEAARDTRAQLTLQANDYKTILAQVALDVSRQREDNARLREQVKTQQATIEARDRARRWQRIATVAIAIALLLLLVFAGRQVRKAARLRGLSLTDELTGLSNRRSILAFAQEQAQIGRRLNDPLSLVMLDIDHFKRINDEHGHAAGDTVLRFFAKALSDELRQGSRAGRTGGEEFLAVLPHCDADHGVLAAERLRRRLVSLRIPFQDRELTVTASFGVITSPPAAGSVEQLVALADQALYAAKRDGRDRVVHGAQTPAGGSG